MTTQPEAKQVPLVERLESVPVALRVPVAKDPWRTSFYAVGAMAHEAAAELRRLHSVNADLLEALQLALSAHGRMLMSDPPQDAWKAYGVEGKARAAIAKATEVKP